MNETLTPHLSLVYSKLWPVPKDISKAMEHDVIAANIGISCSSSCCDSKLKDTINGWEGGRILLVSGLHTDVKIFSSIGCVLPSKRVF